MTQGEYMAAVESAREHIAAGDVYQLVLSVNFAGETDLDPFDVYRGLRLLNPSPYMYFCELGDTKVIGSSPEALVRLRGSGAELRPIAGTRPRYNDDETDRRAESELLDDAKEAAEHVMLVDLARNDLGRVAVPGIDQGRPLPRHRAIQPRDAPGERGHRSAGAGVDAFDLFAAAFPAGTVVGAPKVRALEILAELGARPRGIYAARSATSGTVGSMDQAITIRTSSWESGRYSYQAGAGIVADSVPAAEWEKSGPRPAPCGAPWKARRVGCESVSSSSTTTTRSPTTSSRPCASSGPRSWSDQRRHRSRGRPPARSTHLVVSPGPGRPESAGESMNVIEGLMDEVPILGVCLGHQALAAVLGGRVERAARTPPGKSSPVYHDSATIYAGLPNPFGPAGITRWR